ncbi:GNAT family N-acetyltransferase [Opitutus sp. ER46]|uniref:GNAT family N-acetyltransferase n=1 Tax=Opitutus sp. ER46 TaxID=2161864 RepID=UPI000D302FD0|nr:GNAT family N-acetyltransferase [Opitutus sp. ER46]PTX94442.1 N-acetyltransferase [Opitutus sp. ER46]
MGLTDFTVRDAVEADLPAIVEIYNQTIPGRMVTADTEPVTVESRLPWFRAHNPAKRPLWVALEHGQVCAWLSLNSFYGRPAYFPTAEVSLYVAESHRRRGLGQGLLERIIAHAPACEVRTLLGFIWAHNEPSMKLFAAHGFTPWGHLPRVAVLDGIERDLVIVGRRLTA